MSSIGAIWGMLKMVATKVPWGQVVENAPAVADLVARAKDRLRGSSQNDLEEQLVFVYEKNVKLEKKLAETADQLTELSNTLQAVANRQKTLTIVAAISLLLAISSMLLWIAK
jgi:hypothetical protein